MKAILRCLLATSVVATALSSTAAFAESVLDRIKARGVMNCPVPTGGYVTRAEVDDKGIWRGFDVDFCRATAAAILGDGDKVNFVPISWAQRGPALHAGDIDAIIMSAGWTLSRDTEGDLDFTIPYLLIGLQFMVRADSKITQPEGMDGGTICVPGGSTTERQVAVYMNGKGLSYQAITFETTEETAQGFLSGRCDAMANAGVSLGILKSQQQDPSLYAIIPEVPLTIEGNAMAVRGGDKEMLVVLNYVRSALLEADVLGITAENAEESKTKLKDVPRAAYLLGVTPGAGARMGLPNDWAYNAIRAVGNYGQIYDRYMGEGSPYKIPPGLNAVYTKGGLHYPTTID